MNYQELLTKITADPRYLANLDWGESRPGHPEGTIRAHLTELEQNLARLRPKLNHEDGSKLLLLIHAHDTFKPDAKSGVAITDPRSHASLARAFLAEYCPDQDLLAMVQFHDEPYAMYRQAVSRGGECDRARLAQLLAAIEDWNLFLAFLIIDGCTAGKSREPLEWFFTTIAGKIRSNFTAADILPL